MRQLHQKNYPIQAKKDKSNDWNFIYKFSKLYFLFGDVTVDIFGNPATDWLIGKKYYFQPDLTLEKRNITSLRVFSNESFGGNGLTGYYFTRPVTPLSNSALAGFFINLLDINNNYIIKDAPLLTFLYDPTLVGYNRNRKCNLNNISLEKSYIITNQISLGGYPANSALVMNFYTKYLTDGSLYNN